MMDDEADRTLKHLNPFANAFGSISHFFIAKTAEGALRVRYLYFVRLSLKASSCRQEPQQFLNPEYFHNVLIEVISMG